MDLAKRWYSAKEKGNEDSMKRALKAMSKHKEEDEKLKKKAEAVYHYWY